MSRPEFFELWVYLSASPLLGLTLTLGLHGLLAAFVLPPLLQRIG